MNKIIYGLSLAMGMGLWSCTSDEAAPDVNVAVGERVPLTITLSRGAEDTRTNLEENTQVGGLTQTWAEGDEIYLYNAQGAEAGKLTLESGQGTKSGVFTGDVTAASGDYRLWYFGTSQSSATDATMADKYPHVSVSNGQVTLDLKAPKFENVAEFSKVDVMSQTANITVTSGKAMATNRVTMQSHVALARFSLKNLPASTKGTLKVYDTGAATEGNIYTKQTLSLGSGSKVGNATETSAYEFKEWASDKDLYIAFVPANYSLKFEYVYDKDVTETVNGTSVKNTYPIKNVHSFEANQAIQAGIYYQTFNKTDGATTGTPSGVEVPMEIDDTGNPGNMGNWGGNHGSLGGVPEFIYAGNNNDDAWVSNDRVISNRKYKKTKDLRYNAIKNGHLISGDYNGQSDYEAKYFQWGRLLGFPWRVMYVDVTMLSYARYCKYSDLKYIYPFGMNEYTDATLYYSWDMDSRPTYAVTTAWKSGMKPQQAINSSIVYITGDGIDYLKSEYRSLNWSERSGNPCPDGFKVPTKDELSLFVPSNPFTTSHVEYKMIKGVRYAVRWMLSKDKQSVSVNTACTERTDVEIDDDIFNDSNNLILETSGILYEDNEYAGSALLYDVINDSKIGDCKIGYYWSSSYIQVGTNIYGWALRVGINEDNVNIEMEQMEPIVGCGIIPIRDQSAKATGFQPWFPIGI